jgi:hypothetical protein
VGKAQQPGNGGDTRKPGKPLDVATQRLVYTKGETIEERVTRAVWLTSPHCDIYCDIWRIPYVCRSSSCFSEVAIKAFRVLAFKYSKHLSFSSCSRACNQSKSHTYTHTSEIISGKGSNVSSRRLQANMMYR